MATDDFFRARLDSMIDMRHPLVVLATRMPWAEIEVALAPLLAHKDRSGRMVQDADLFGPTAQLAGAGLSTAGRPRVALRLMVALLYLKHAFNLSDEELCERRRAGPTGHTKSALQISASPHKRLLCGVNADSAISRD